MMTKPPNTAGITAASQETVRTMARLQSDLDLAKAENVRLREALKETVRVLDFAFTDGAIPEDIVLGLCIDPYGMLKDAKAALGEQL